ncbi:MAG: histidinol dehydrogenase [Rhodospirillaceae bacterium]|mgnify:FL=1|nr:histidinol dehydrogenase [Rhodospirillaceae bacterium]|tara:strand:+ start:100 stop:1398 length:1299 start_codon:yes stop_codon:yes gene_type:complete
MPLRLNTIDNNFDAAFFEFLGANREAAENVDAAVADILSAVRTRGDDAVLEYTERFDRMVLDTDAMRFTAEEIREAKKACDTVTLGALNLAADRIRAFHAKQLPVGLDYVDDDGIRLGARWMPLSAVGLYVPGGTAAYPSSVLMNAIPAKVAGCNRVVIVVPTPDGIINPLVLAAAEIAGVTEMYRIGGAQAVGALAYGTRTIPAVDKITGPGNAYVAAAKRQVYGTVGIDMIAGPSEIVVVADGENDPDWIAADLLSQAEHDESAQSVLITDDAAFAERVSDAVDRQISMLDRREIADKSWSNNGALIVVENMDEAVSLVDRFAPEHLELAVSDADTLAMKVNHAGAIFLGRYAPEAIGDYIAGPNHVLPTSRSARFSSGLGVLDFMKRTTFVGCDADSLAKIGSSVVTLAKAEGLGAHARSVMIRLNRNE